MPLFVETQTVHKTRRPLSIQRQGELDIGSIVTCLETARCLEQGLMQFDFRNTDLRRKFDGVKYTVSSMDTADAQRWGGWLEDARKRSHPKAPDPAELANILRQRFAGAASTSGKGKGEERRAT